jgi:putative transcriptional regulator
VTSKSKKRIALINARKEAGLTQQGLADMVGIDRGFLSNIERGNYSPSLQVAYSIARALNTTIESLFFNGNVRKTGNKKKTA